MARSLKVKIFLSFLLLILMLLVAGVMSILEFQKIGDSVEAVMKNNYQSIETSKLMLDAVEREDSGVLMWMLGDSTKGNETVNRSHAVMQKALQDARLNISETNEEEYIKRIEQEYGKFHFVIQKIIGSNSNLQKNKNVYSQELESLFGNTKKAINSLMVLNQDQMYAQSTTMKENSQRAMMPAIISVLAAVLFAILLNFFISIFFINPIHRIIDEIKSFYPEKGRIDAKITSKDELKTLETETNNLIRRTLHHNMP